MTEKPMTGEVTVNEVRFGLFRVVWNLSLKMVVNVKYHQEFSLCGTQFGRNFKISTKNMYFNTVTLRCISSSDHSASQSDIAEQSESKSIKLEEKSVLPELKSLHSVEVMYLDKREFQNENECSKWKFHTDQLLVGEKPVLEFWVDFGTNEFEDKIIVLRMGNILRDQTLCDVKFKFTNGEEIGAHAAILSSASSVFATMFQTDFVESKTRIVDIADIDMDFFKEMLTYIYTGKAPNMKKKNFARSVYEVADKYDIESLKDVCEDLLVTQLSNNNAMELLVWAQFHSLPNLIENTVQFIARNSQELCSQPAWLDFVKDHPQLWVKIMQRMANIVQDYYSDKK